MPYRFALILLLLAACSGGSQDAPSPQPPAAPQPAALPGGEQYCVEGITIRQGQLAPPRLTVKAPCAIMFTNRDDDVVQIQGNDTSAPDGIFLLGEMGKDQSWAHTYKDPGEFEYWNTKNPSMKGIVAVVR